MVVVVTMTTTITTNDDDGDADLYFQKFFCAMRLLMRPVSLLYTGIRGTSMK